MKKLFIICSLMLMILFVSCQKQEVYNPFATPEGCVKEYLDAKDSCDFVRMLNCFAYEPKYERLLREELQKQLDKENSIRDHSPNYFYRTDSVKLKEQYPNSAVVTIYYTEGSDKATLSSRDYDINLVKDSTNWKIETQISFSISSY